MGVISSPEGSSAPAALVQDAAVLDRAREMVPSDAIQAGKSLVRRGGRRPFAGRPPAWSTAARRDTAALAKALSKRAEVTEALLALALDERPKGRRISPRTQAYACYLLLRLLGLRVRPGREIEALAAFRTEVAERAARFMFEETEQSSDAEIEENAGRDMAHRIRLRSPRRP